jgi:hypothetical protein
LWSGDDAREVMRFLTAARCSSELNRPVSLEEVG